MTSHAAMRARPRAFPFDPVRFCVLTTVALIAWILGPPICVLMMSALGLWGYAKAIRGGLRESRCVLKRPMLVLAYLGAAFVAAAAVLIYPMIA
jgi:hypothetical protein